MRIQSLYVANFRAITQLSLENLADTVVIAGPNGCGKSCVFDAIRLLKSAYGGYLPSEWHQWFAEFALNINQGDTSWIPLFQDRSKPIILRADFCLSEAERTYLRDNAQQILTEQIWRELVPEVASWRSIRASPLAANLRNHEPEVHRRVAEQLPLFLSELGQAAHRGEVVVAPGAGGRAAPSRLLELVFGVYDPQHIGIIDYHGANRNYSREQVGGINLNIESADERMRQHALYNYSNKYANLKSEMAGSYVRQLLAARAEGDEATDESLTDTLSELFTTFFPGKAFLGPTPTRDGRLLFPVRTANGAEHDIDELSAGEKEVLYGYLRLRNAAPKNSVLLIDEPELHLNPRLISGLVSFYHRHLGKSLGTQLWMVTHSDTLIREAVGQDGFSVFHMHPPGRGTESNQATPVQATADLDRLIIELVGDLAAYRPGAKVVVFEGGGDSNFDVRMVCQLFPEFQSATNPIAAGSKRRVSQLYELLEKARMAGTLSGRFYAVTDSDGEPCSLGGEPRTFRWDVYHIENYLLEPLYIRRVLSDLNVSDERVATGAGVFEALRACAEETIDALVAHQLRTTLNREFVACIDLGHDPARKDVGVALSEALVRSRDKVLAVVQAVATSLPTEETALRANLRKDLEDGTWARTFRGRDVLKRFVAKFGSGLSYEAFRDLIVARMKDDGYRPVGMSTIISAILADSAA